MQNASQVSDTTWSKTSNAQVIFTPERFGLFGRHERSPPPNQDPPPPRARAWDNSSRDRKSWKMSRYVVVVANVVWKDPSRKNVPFPKTQNRTRSTRKLSHPSKRSSPKQHVGVLSGCRLLHDHLFTHLSCLPPAGLVPHVPGKGNAPGTWIRKAVSTPPWGQESRPPPQRCAAGIHALEMWHHGRTVQAGRKSEIVPRDECVCVGPTSVCQV